MPNHGVHDTSLLVVPFKSWCYRLFCWSLMVSGCFEPSQPHRVISGLRSLTEGDRIPQMVRMKRGRGAWSNRSTRRQGQCWCQSTCATSRPAPSHSASSPSSSSLPTTPSWSAPTSGWPDGPASQTHFTRATPRCRSPAAPSPTPRQEMGMAAWWWCPTSQHHLLFRCGVFFVVFQMSFRS